MMLFIRNHLWLPVSLFLAMPAVASVFEIELSNPEHKHEAANLKSFLEQSLQHSHQQKKASEAEKLLRETGLFFKVNCQGSSKIICHLTRLNKISDIQFKGIPAALLQADLRKKLPLHKGDILPSSDAQINGIIKKTRERVKSYLHKNGYFSSFVKVSLHQIPKKPFATLKIEILKGFFRRIKQVEVIGAHNLRPARIQTTFKALCMSFQNLIRSIYIGSFSCYSKGLIEDNIRYLERLYADKGFFQADIQVSHQFIPCKKNKEAQKSCVSLRVRIDEGPRVKIQINIHDGQWTEASGFKAFVQTVFGLRVFSRLLNTNLSGGIWPNDETINVLQLEKATTFRESKIVNALEVQNSVKAIKTALGEFGYMSPHVSGHIRFQSDEHILVQFDVTPRNPTRLTKRTLSGNHQVPSSKITSTLTFRAQIATAFHTGHIIESDLQADKHNILALYKSLGFHGTNVSSSLASPDGHRLHLNYNIDEGIQNFVDSLQISGGQSQLNKQALQSLSNCNKGNQVSKQQKQPCKNSVFFEGSLQQDKLQIQNIYYEAGFLRPDIITTTKKLTEDRYQIEYVIKGPLVRQKISAILLEGNLRTNRNAIFREAKLPTKRTQFETLTPEHIGRAISRLRQSGLFDKVSYRFLQVEKKPERSLLVELVERESLKVDTAASFSTDNLFAAYFGVSETNLLGSMLSLNFDMDWGLFWGRRSDLSLALTWPRIWGTRLYLHVQAPYFLYENKLQTKAPQRHFEAIASAGLTYQITDKLSTSLMYIFRLDKWEIPPVGGSFFSNPYESLKSMDGLLTVLKRPSSFRGILRPRLQYISLDNPFNPKAGISLSTSLEFSGKALAADNAYSIFEIDATAYTTKWDITLAARLRIQRAFIGDPTKMWWVLKYQSNFDTLGGDRSVRGYPQDDIGFWGRLYDDRGNFIRSADTDDVVGFHPGNLSILANLELRFPLFTNLPLGQLDGAVFTDFGLTSLCQGLFTCTESSPDTDSTQSRPLGWSIGFGVRYVFPVGPISLDYAVAPLQAGSGIFNRQSRLHLMFGYAF